MVLRGDWRSQPTNYGDRRPDNSTDAMSVGADRLKPLTRCSDVVSLRSAVEELCTEFGKVTRLDVLTLAEAERRRALCLLRLESAAQEQKLMATLRASRFGDDVLIVVDLARGSARSVL